MSTKFYFLAFTLFSTMVTHGQTTQSYTSKNGCIRMSIPENWELRSSEDLDIAKYVMQEMAPNKKIADYEALLQPKNTELFETSYIFVWSSENAMSEELLHDQSISATDFQNAMQKAGTFVDFFASGQLIYDNENDRLYVFAEASPTEDNTTVVATCHFLTATGYVATALYCSKSDWQSQRLLFDNMINSTRISEQCKIH